MKKILLSAAVLVSAVLAGAPVYAQGRVFVSGTGDDSFPCSRTAPCKTFPKAISVVAARGEINCLDSGGFGEVTIAKEVTIDCTGVNAGILNAGTGVTVNIPGGAVTLRNLTIDGLGTGLVGVRIVAASKVNLENVEIFSQSQQGVFDARTSAGGVLTIANSTIRNNASSGVATTATGGSGIVLENVILKQNLNGLGVSSGVTGIVKGSSFSNSVAAGLVADTGAKIFISDSLVTFNATGMSINGAVAMANTSVVFNTTGMSGAAATTFGNNIIFGNTSAGTAPVAAGPASTDLGQK